MTIGQVPFITGTTVCFPLIGHPVAQVKSPPVINAFFTAQGIDAVMVPFDVAPALVPAFFDVVRGWANCGGVSVTVPHKQAAFACVDEVSERARAIGAVNSVRRETGGRLVGENTDGLAFVAALRSNGARIAGAQCLLIGAGGAGSAIAHALAEAEAAALTVLDIDTQRRAALAAAIARRYPALRIHEEPGSDVAPSIVVNASTLGMRADDPLPFDLSRLGGETIVADVVTKQTLTPFLHAAQARGFRIQTGEEMAAAQRDVQTAFFAVDRFRRDRPQAPVSRSPAPA